MSTNISWLWGCLGRVGLEGALDPQAKVDANYQDSAGQDAGLAFPGT